MAWYAKIKNDVVSEVMFVVDSLDSDWLYREHGGTWLKCSEDGSIRGCFPSVGFSYNRDEDEFRAPQPFASWSYDQTKKCWVAPASYPEDGKIYTWEKAKQQWIEVTA